MDQRMGSLPRDARADPSTARTAIHTEVGTRGVLWNGRNVCDVYTLAEEAYACGGDMGLLAYAHWRGPVNRHVLLPGVHIPYGETAATVNDLTSAAVAANLLDMTALTSWLTGR